jgi:hypothetical protein
MDLLDPRGWNVMVEVVVGAVVCILLVLGLIIWRKGQPFAEGQVFRASRLSRGNHLMPTQVLVSPTNVVHYTPQWFGKYEHSIHMAHIASVSIDTHIIFSDVLIETTGGADPIHCRGHYRSDAVRMQRLIEEYQTAYYRGAGPTPDRPVPAAAPGARPA